MSARRAGAHARHWLILLAADRVDVWEHPARKLLPWALPAAAAGLVARSLLRRRAPRRAAWAAAH